MTQKKGGGGKGKTTKVGRDSASGKFVPVKEAKNRPKTTQVESIKRDRKKPTDSTGPRGK